MLLRKKEETKPIVNRNKQSTKQTMYGICLFKSQEAKKTSKVRARKVWVSDMSLASLNLLLDAEAAKEKVH